MSKHTPGPWYACGVPYYEFWITTDAPPHTGRQLKDRIAIVKAEGPDFDGESREANAHLIAAAPEMLEALKASLTIEVSDPGHVHTLAVISKISAAIAKAEGRS